MATSSVGGVGSTMPGDSPFTSTQTESSNTLSNEAFMRLFLEQLKNQDPTSPMETQDILTQTAQLTQVEMQEKMKTAMESMTNAMKSMQETNEKTIAAQEKLVQSQEGMLAALELLGQNIQNSNILTGYNTISMIGQIAETGYNSYTIENNEPVKFCLYFDEPIDISKGDAKITITSTDSEGNVTVIKEISLTDAQYDGKQGYIEFEWDTTDNNGSYVAAGSYTITAEYNLDDTTNEYLKTELGRGEVTSVMFDAGIPYIKLGEYFIVPVDFAHTFYPKNA